MNDSPKTSEMNSECDAENDPSREHRRKGSLLFILGSNNRASSVGTLRGKGQPGGEEEKAKRRPPWSGRLTWVYSDDTET